jgi:hypothetical protein
MPRRMPNLNGFSLASAWQPAHSPRKRFRRASSARS